MNNEEITEKLNPDNNILDTMESLIEEFSPKEILERGEIVDVLLSIDREGPVDGTIQQRHVSLDKQKDVSVDFTPCFLKQLKQLLVIVNDFDPIEDPRVQSLISPTN